MIIVTVPAMSFCDPNTARSRKPPRTEFDWMNNAFRCVLLVVKFHKTKLLPDQRDKRSIDVTGGDDKMSEQLLKVIIQVNQTAQKSCHGTT